MAFENLKQKTPSEGLFAPNANGVPRYRSARTGDLATGAAIRDVLHVIETASARLEIVLAPCRVQGRGR